MLSECRNCARGGDCAVEPVMQTVWGDSGERVTHADVAGAMNLEGLTDPDSCEALLTVERLEAGTIEAVSAQLQLLA